MPIAVPWHAQIQGKTIGVRRFHGTALRRHDLFVSWCLGSRTEGPGPRGENASFTREKGSLLDMVHFHEFAMLSDPGI